MLGEDDGDLSRRGMRRISWHSRVGGPCGRPGKVAGTGMSRNVSDPFDQYKSSYLTTDIDMLTCVHLAVIGQERTKRTKLI